MQVGKFGGAGFIVDVFEFYAGAGIGNKSDFFDEKRDENTINIQKIEFGIDIGVRSFVENERNLTLNPVRFLQFPDFDDVVSGYQYR